MSQALSLGFPDWLLWTRIFPPFELASKGMGDSDLKFVALKNWHLDSKLDRNLGTAFANSVFQGEASNEPNKILCKVKLDLGD